MSFVLPILQLLAPLIKIGIEQLLKHHPQAGASEAHVATHAAVLSSLQHADKCIAEACEVHKA